MYCQDQEKEIEREVQAADKAQNDLRNKERELEDAQAEKGTSTQFKETCQSYVNEITKDTVKEINVLMLTSNNAKLTNCLEEFVALLRNKAGSTNADVELFFKDYTKLVSKMRKIETTASSLSLINDIAGKMTEIRANMGAEETLNNKVVDLSKYKVFANWSINFC